MDKKNLSLLQIIIPKGVKRSWSFVRNLINGAIKKEYLNGCKIEGKLTPLDLRKGSKNNIPLELIAGCCNTVLEIRRVKDFPLKDKWCKCGKTKMIEWIEMK